MGVCSAYCFNKDDKAQQGNLNMEVIYSQKAS